MGAARDRFALPPENNKVELHSFLILKFQVSKICFFFFNEAINVRKHETQFFNAQSGKKSTHELRSFYLLQMVSDVLKSLPREQF